MSTLAETEVAVLLTPCDCGHTINDHGELAGCWACGDVGNDPCDVSFEALLVARVAAIVDQRVNTSRCCNYLEEEDRPCEGVMDAGWPVHVCRSCRAQCGAQVHPQHAREPQPTADDQTEAECQPNREASR